MFPEGVFGDIVDSLSIWVSNPVAWFVVYNLPIIVFPKKCRVPETVTWSCWKTLTLLKSRDGTQQKIVFLIYFEEPSMPKKENEILKNVFDFGCAKKSSSQVLSAEIIWSQSELKILLW